MAVKICEQAGICKIDKDGNIVELQREYFRQGWIFRDWDAFRNHPNAPCYVPELFDTVYTRNDLIDLCNGQEEIAEELFYQLDWQSPSTLLDEWEDTEVIGTCKKCGKLYFLFGIKKCPYCGADHEEDNC